MSFYKIGDKLYKSYDYSKDPFDGQYFEENILSMTRDYFHSGVVVNSVLYTRSQEGSIQSHNCTHYSGSFDDDEFCDFFDQIIAGVRMSIMEQADVMAQVSGIIRQDSRLVRVTLGARFKQCFRVRSSGSDVTFVKVGIKEVSMEVPSVMRINSKVNVKPLRQEVMVNVTTDRVGVSDRRGDVETIVIHSGEIHKAVMPFVHELRDNNLLLIEPQKLFLKINRERRDVCVITEWVPRVKHIECRLALYLCGKVGKPHVLVGNRVSCKFQNAETVANTPPFRMCTYIRIKWYIQQPVKDKSELQ